MKLSTRGRYALRLMLDIAMQPEGSSVSLKSVAERQEISLKYLEQIVAPLNRSGLLRAIRGAQGGYQLSKPARDYTVGLILRTIEGSLAPVACLDDDCPRKEQCAAFEVYQRIDAAVDQVVDSITLADMVELQRKKQ